MLKRLFFDEQTLALVALPGAAPFQHDRGERRVLTGPPCERRIAGRQEREMIEIRATETQRATVAGKNNHRVLAESVAAVVAARLPVRHEDPQVPQRIVPSTAKSPRAVKVASAATAGTTSARNPRR